jgi:hypothetical protein
LQQWGGAGTASDRRRVRGLDMGRRIRDVQPETITSVDKSEEAGVIATLVSAFIADPVERWLFAEPLRYLTHFARFVAAFGMAGFASETVFKLGDFAAVAIWIPPELNRTVIRSSRR